MTQDNPEKKKGDFLGMPMNWDRKRPFKNLWNAEDDRIILPKSFGIGWTLISTPLCGLSVSSEKKAVSRPINSFVLI